MKPLSYIVILAFSVLISVFIPFQNNTEIIWSNKILCDSLEVEVRNTDTLQEIINDYCRQLDMEQSNIRKIDKDSIQIDGYKKQLTELKKTQIDLISKILENDIKKITLDSVSFLKSHVDTLYYSMLKIQDSTQKKNKQRNEYIGLLKRIRQTKDTLLKNIQFQTSNLIGSRSFNYKETDINIFIAYLDSNDISMHLKNDSGKNFYNAGSLLANFKKNKIEPLMITNAGMYTQDFYPKGLYIQDFKTIVKLDTSTVKHNVNFYMYPNGVFCIDSIGIPYILTTQEYIDKEKDEMGQIRFATQSGPMLVIKDTIHQRFTKGSNNKNIRNGVGILSDKKVIFAISVQPINFYDFATFFKDIFNCENALYLDGAISIMYISDLDTNSIDGRLGPLIAVTKKH